MYGLAFGPTSGTLTLGGSVGNSLTVGFDGVKVSSGAGTVLISAPLTLSAANTQIINNSASTLTIATLIGGSNQLTFGGTGTTYLSNTSAGGTGGGGSVSTTGGILLNGGTLHFNVSSSAVTGGVTINGGTASMDYGNFSSGPFVSTQAFTINSGGTLIINAAHALASYAPGATLIVNGGTVVSNDEQYLGSLTLNGGSTIKGTGGDGSYEFRSNGSSNTNITSVASSTASTIGTNLSVVYSNYVFNVGAGSVSTGADLTVNGTIFGTTASYGVYKSGPGNLVLTASNTYAGTTAVNAGTLTLASGASLNAASTVSFGGGTLSIPAAQTQTFAGATVATGGSSINAPNGHREPRLDHAHDRKRHRLWHGHGHDDHGQQRSPWHPRRMGDDRRRHQFRRRKPRRCDLHDDHTAGRLHRGQRRRHSRQWLRRPEHRCGHQHRRHRCADRPPTSCDSAPPVPTR